MTFKEFLATYWVQVDPESYKPKPNLLLTIDEAQCEEIIIEQDSTYTLIFQEYDVSYTPDEPMPDFEVYSLSYQYTSNTAQGD